MNFPTSLFLDDILAGRSQLQKTSKSLLATAILLHRNMSSHPLPLVSFLAAGG